MDADQWKDFLIAHAASLRGAGVLSFVVGPCSASLAPLPPPIDDKPIPRKETPDSDVDSREIDPFEDPRSYPGGRVPHFDIDKQESEF